MPAKKTPQEFINELKEKNPEVIPLETYINNKTKIECKCIKCGNIWFSAPTKLLTGRGCPKCARKKSADNRRYSKEEFAEKVRLIHPEFEVIGEYINSTTKIEIHCTKCDNRWSVVPSSILHGTGCPKCNKRYRKNTDDFSRELSLINPYIQVLGTYKNAHEKILVKCTRCDNEWEAEPNGLLKGNACPFCSHSQTSTIEQVLYNSFCFLVGEDKVINRDKTIIGKELDIVIQELGLAIEFGAWYWHSDKIQNDYEKEKLCDLSGIHLITIYEGCPDANMTTPLKNAIYLSNIISNEADYTTIKGVILSLCDKYHLESEKISKNWKQIIKKSKEDCLKKDAEEFAQELTSINPNIEYIGEYNGSKDQVRVQCKVCGKEWRASSAYDLLHGHGCPECAKNRSSMSQRMSPEEFQAIVNKINPHIELLEDYKGAKTSILCRCKICGTEWKAKPYSIRYKKCNCPSCSPNTKKTNEQFLIELSHSSNSLVPLEDYKNSSTKIRFKCLNCDHEWYARPSDVLKGTGCPKCANRIKKTHNDFVSKVRKKNSNIEIIGEYKNSKTKVKCRCKVCGYEWLGLPTNLQSGAGCQRCARTIRLTNEEFIKRLSLTNPSINPLEAYVNLKSKVLCECVICGNKWMALPGNLLKGHGCPKCKAAKTRIRKSRKVLCVETGKTYESITAAKKETGITTISDCLNQRTKTAGGLHWKYI